jgi:hypothetical protein
MGKRRSCNGLKSFAHLAIVLGAQSAATSAYAQEQIFDWSVDVGAEHSDNVGRSADNEESESIATAGLAVTYETDGPRLDTDAGVELQYRNYLDDVYESEVVGGANVALTYAFAPERFLWVVEDNFGQLANERQLPDTPDNRQNFNYFTTGPDIVLPLGGRTNLQLSGRWSDVNYEEGTEDDLASDNQVLFGELSLIRQLNDVSSVSLNGSVSETRFDEPTDVEDYDIQEGFLRYALTTTRTNFAVDAGYTVLNQSGESSDGPLARVQLTRRVTARSQLTVEAGTEFTATPETFRREQAVIGVDVGPGAAIAASDSFRNDYAYLIWNTDWTRSGFAIELSASDESYENLTDFDREQLSALASWSRDMARTLTLGLRAAYLDEKYVRTGVQFDEWSAGVSLEWRLTRRFSLQLRGDHYEGAGENGGRDYEENRAYLGVSYGRGVQ